MHDLPTGLLVPSVRDVLATAKALSRQKSKIYFAGEEVDYGFNFHAPCTHEQIAELEKITSCSLPDDYKEFLLYTNGLELATDSTSSRLCSVDEIFQIVSVFEWRPKNFLAIGAHADATTHTLINLAEQGRLNMYVVDIMADEHFSRLHCGFRTFLDRFISTYGDSFWEWGATETKIRQSEPPDSHPGAGHLAGTTFPIGDY